jgi:hypothetical protein
MEEHLKQRNESQYIATGLYFLYIIFELFEQEVFKSARFSITKLIKDRVTQQTTVNNE